MQYTVKRGDSLYSIAKNFKVSVDAIKSSNNLTSDLLSIGQILIIPVDEEITPDTYTVKQGDSLYSIAKRYNLNVSTIMNINNLENTLLNVGQQLYLKNPINSPVHVGLDICDTLELVDDPLSGSLKYDTYTVKRGDSLYSIAKKFNTDIGTIKYINDLDNELLSIGQVLKIPKSVSSDNTYTVKRGDSLYSIAKSHGIGVNDIKVKNNLSSNNLSIGQILIIPKVTYPNAILDDSTTYTVMKGDSLYSIAKKFNTSVDYLISKNNLHNTILSIGQVLKIK